MNSSTTTDNINNHFQRVFKLYQTKHRAFGNAHGLARWYEEQLARQNHRCYYCETPIALLRQLIEAGLLKTRAIKGGKYRGGHLEIDKQGSEYDKDTCVLVCYYCNNDKSYIFSQADYKAFMGPAKHAYFLHLEKQLKQI